MKVCHLCCSKEMLDVLHGLPELDGLPIDEVEQPVTAINRVVDMLIVGPCVRERLSLAATVSDWEVPPVMVIMINDDRWEELSRELHYHPRVGRGVFCARETGESLADAVRQASGFFRERIACAPDMGSGERYAINNVSPRWLFQQMMETMDEYIYFKDVDSRFLAISRYYLSHCRESSPKEVLGKTDYELYDKEHADEAYFDERKLVEKELSEIHKDEHVTWDEFEMWVHTRKLRLYTPSGFIAGTYGLSRNISRQKELDNALQQNLKSMEAELELARNLQQALMQPKVPFFAADDGKPALEIATRYIATSHLSGDFFSIMETPGGCAGVLIADVMGHGVRSAMVTAMIQIALNQLENLLDEPAAFMKQLNGMFHQSLKSSGQVIFATAAYLHIDPKKRVLTCSQGGSNHGMLLPAEGEGKPLSAGEVGPAIGLLPESDYVEHSCHLKPSDQVILYTDGVIEVTADGEEYGTGRLLKALKVRKSDTLQGQLDGLLQDVYAYGGAEEIDDDVCLIAVRVPAGA